MSDSLCSLCQIRPPTFVCFCSECPVCQLCISQHLLDFPTLPHKPVPINSRELILFLRSEPKAARCSASPSLEEKQLYREEVGKEVDRVVAAREEAMQEIERLRLKLELQGAKAVEEMKLTVGEKASKVITALQRKLTDLDDPAQPPFDFSEQSSPGGFVSLTTELKDLDITEEIKSAFRATFELKDDPTKTKAGSTVIYKLIGGSTSIGSFDCRSQQLGKMATTAVRFFHNSVTCEGPNGHVYITGGSLTGRSRNECYLFSPLSGAVQELQSMNIARRSHAAIYCSRTLFVFGGLLDEERLSLCEAFSGEKDEWRPIAQMNERRAYLGCCEFQDKVYIGGGAEKSSCEVYDCRTNSFGLLVVSTVLIEDNCCMLALPSCILLFHGSFQGDVTRLDPSNNRFTRQRDMCVGNSWSSCSPVLVNNTIFMLRSESIFKYDIDTGDSEYVTRIGKTTRKRVGLEG